MMEFLKVEQVGPKILKMFRKQPPGVFYKKTSKETKIPQNSQENPCVGASFLIKLQKLLRIPFLRKPPGDCFLSFFEIYLRIIIYCPHKGFYDSTVFHFMSTVSSCF